MEEHSAINQNGCMPRASVSLTFYEISLGIDDSQKNSLMIWVQINDGIFWLVVGINVDWTFHL